MEYDRFELFETGGERVATLAVARGETLYECIERHGWPVRTRCRGSASCGLCWVQVEEGYDELPPMQEPESQLLRKVLRKAPNARLACLIHLPEGRGSMRVSTDYWKPASSEG